MARFRAISLPVPDDWDAVISGELDVNVHFKEGQFIAYTAYLDKLKDLGFEVTVKGSDYSTRDYAIATATTDGLKLTVFGPEFAKPDPPPEEPNIGEKLADATRAEIEARMAEERGDA